jgi:hypothetical protein
MRRHVFLSWAIGCLATIVLVSSPVAEATTGARPTGATLIVATWPGENPHALAAAAGARILATAGPAILVTAPRPDLALALWRAGALVVVGDPRLVALLR